ncbi:hypothetical protein [Ewingella americana]|uniref:Uncharacterized protein n=1 Tax=Ewingella americana TaxID=41202 RepID=A0A502GDN5_9GAMM|nr:hypothetical protein [Ewingella americana]TPG60025.1 hypothetical protein EAH77_15775 [Ewingella americana]
MLKLSAINSVIASEVEIQAKKVKVVRDGQVVTKEVHLHKKKRKMTPKMRQALQKAQKKAHAGGADKKRAKSMKIHERTVHNT